jgi:plastocyanin
LQVPKRHIPIVGILGIIVIAAAGGGIYYYQFVVPHNVTAYTPVHRLLFMSAIIYESGGFHVNDTAYLNQTTIPSFNATYGPDMSGVKYQNYQGSSDNRTIDARVGDTITFYIHGKSATGSNAGLQTSTGHGFAISGPAPPTVDSGGPIPCAPSPPCIPFNQWFTVTVTFTVAGTYTYFCTTPCSPLHGNMDGSIVVS